MHVSKWPALAVVAAVALALAGADAHAQPKKGAKKKAEDHLLVAELRHAHRVLARADPIYKGHRARALKEINHAIGELEKELKRRGLKDKTKNKKDLPDKVSHAHVRETAAEVGVILKQLQGMKSTLHRERAVAHLKDAQKELRLALASVKEKKQR